MSEGAPAPPPARRAWRGAALLLASGIWLALLLHATRVYQPSSANLEEYNSDVAILSVMANGGGEITPYWLFYLGQDRYGAWPLLALNAVGRALGQTWPPAAVTAWATLFLFLAAVPLWSLLPRAGVVLGAAFLAVVLAHPGTRWLYEHVYGWQIGALAWTWAFYRGVARSPPGRGWGWTAAAFAGSLLACWSSPVSGPILFAWAMLEWRWARRVPGAAAGARTLAVLSGAAAFGALGEVALRKAHNFYGARVLGDRSFTSIRLDWGHLAENFAAVLRALETAGPFWPWAVLGAWGAIDVLARRRDEAPLERDLGLVIVQAMSAALLALAIAGAVSHVRDSEYSPRFLTPVHVFATCAGMLALFRLVARRLAERWRPAAAAGLGAAYLLAALLWMPAPAEDPWYREVRDAARFAASPESPSRVVYGDYWESLVLAGPQPELAPVVLEGQIQRIPWNVERLRASKAVLLSDILSKSGPGPDPWMVAFGAPLRRRTAEPVYRSQSVALYAYDNRASAALPLEPPPSAWPLCVEGAVELRFASLQRGWLLAEPEAIGGRFRLEVGPQGAPAAMESWAKAWAEVPPGSQLLGFRLEAGAPVESARLVVERPASSAGGPCGARAWLVPD